MELTVVKGGKFTATMGTADLAKGLRTSKRNARNNDYLITCKGTVGIDGVLSALDSITPLSTTVITDAFPFPQIFVFTNLILVCGLGKIYEWNGSSLVLRYTATTMGGLWTAVDFFDYLYLSNGAEAVIRDAESKTFSKTTDLPTCVCMCNYNGQVLIGAPDVSGLGASLNIVMSSVTMTGSVSATLTTV